MIRNIPMMRLVILLFGVLLCIDSQVVFNGDFETGNLSQWDLVQACTSTRIEVYDSSKLPASDAPLPREGKYAAIFRVYNTDVAPCTPTDNPRAQLLTKDFININDEFWEGWSVFFPKSFPVMNRTCEGCDGNPWVLFQEDYGAPFDGSPSLGWDLGYIDGKESLTLNRGAPQYDSIWNTPLVRGQWLDFIVHKVFSSDAKVGYVEGFLNGTAMKFSPCNGCTRFYTPTMHPTMKTNGFFLDMYRIHNLWNYTETYFDAAKVGKTRNDVVPT